MSIIPKWVVLSALAGIAAAQSPKYGVGHAPTEQELSSLSISVAPDGAGLPKGSGSAIDGRVIYDKQCAACHGEKGDGRIPLVGGQGTLATAKPLKTVGSFWPHATSLYNYVNRAMPYQQPGLLKPSEVYAAVAYVLFLNGIVKENEVMDAKSLPKIRMPNRDGFVQDPRPDVGRR